MNTPSVNALDFGQYTGLRAAAQQNDPAALRKTAQQFEALFTQMMLKSMREGLPGDSTLGSQGDFYTSLYDQQLSTTLASGKGLGLADMLLRQLAPAAAAPAGGASSLTPAHTHARAEPTSASAALSAITRATPAGTAGAATVTTATAEAGSGSDPGSDPDPGSADADWNPGDVRGFLDAIRPYAQRAAEKLGVPLRAVMAHAALETGWGRHVTRDADGRPSLNLFGIKTGAQWDGASVQASTQEFRDGAFGRETADFRAYGSLAASFDDYANFLGGQRRYAAVAGAGSVRDFASGLQKAGYATDPDYAHKLMRVARSATLDEALAGPAAPVRVSA